MNDLSGTIAAKSDQLNADDLIGGPITVTITRCIVTDGEQPVSIRYEGDNGKPYKPGKSMRRVLVAVWGKDGNAYAGHKMTLYRDPDVQFGGMAVGGIRISHMTGLDRDTKIPLAVTRGQKRPFLVRPLRDEVRQPRKTLEDALREKSREGSFALQDALSKLDERQRERAKAIMDELEHVAETVDRAKAAVTDLSGTIHGDDDTFPGDL